MPTSTPDFTSIQLSCAKPGCNHTRLQRHHKAHEYIWVAVWIRRRSGEPRFQKFSHRYWSFHEDDTVRICAHHHVEVHEEYNSIIDAHILENNSPLLHEWSWQQADALMKDLTKFCDRWLKKVTPGKNPKTYVARRGR